VGDITNYEKLTVNIETNGTISPQDAVQQSVKILIDHFSIVLSSVASTQPEFVAQEPEAVLEEAVEESEDKPKKKVSKKK
jgi:DNA-directed RNA polymerase subunit alpha